MNTVLQYSPLNKEVKQFFIYPLNLIDALSCFDSGQKIPYFSLTFENGIPLNSNEVDHIKTNQDLIDYLRSVHDLHLVDATVENTDGVSISCHEDQELTIQSPKAKLPSLVKTLLEYKKLDPELYKVAKDEEWKYVLVSDQSEIINIFDSFNDFINR